MIKGICKAEDLKDIILNARVEMYEKRFGKYLYNDLAIKKTSKEQAEDDAANLFEAIEEMFEDENVNYTIKDALEYAASEFADSYTSATEFEAEHNEKQRKMIKENAMAAFRGETWLYTQDEIEQAANIEQEEVDSDED
jgi:hypothetical protein